MVLRSIIYNTNSIKLFNSDTNRVEQNHDFTKKNKKIGDLNQFKSFDLNQTTLSQIHIMIQLNSTKAKVKRNN